MTFYSIGMPNPYEREYSLDNSGVNKRIFMTMQVLRLNFSM